MTVDAAFAAAFDAAPASSGGDEKNPPPAGRVGELTVTAARLVTANGKQKLVFDLVDGDYRWSEWKDGAYAKRFLADLGVTGVTSATLNDALARVVGVRASYETVSASNPLYVNTYLRGVVNLPQSVAVQPPASVQQTAAEAFGEVPWDAQPATASSNAVFGG